VSVVRRGIRVARPSLVLYAQLSPQPHFGVIVGKTVGGAVERNRVKRRLRHSALALIGGGMNVVVRALPSARTAGRGLSADLASAWADARRLLG